MKRNHQDDLVELGVVSVDTQGCLFGIIIEAHGFFCMGLTQE